MKNAPVALYARSAVFNEDEISDQFDELRTYCEGRGWAVAAAYSDTGTKDRPSLQAMLERARTIGDFDAIVVRDISRISRNIADLMSFREELARLNIKLMTTEKALA